LEFPIDIDSLQQRERKCSCNLFILPYTLIFKVVYDHGKDSPLSIFENDFDVFIIGELGIYMCPSQRVWHPSKHLSTV